MPSHQPMARGVTSLMYVGDDAAVTPAKPAVTSKELAVGVLAAYVALSSHGLVRLASAGIAATVGYRAYKAR